MRLHSFWAVIALTSVFLTGSTRAEEINWLMQPPSVAAFRDGDIRNASTSEETASAAGGCENGCSKGSCGNSCCDTGCGSGSGCNCIGNWRDNMQLWTGGDAYKSIGDSGLSNFNPTPFAIGNSFGSVGGLNTSFALGDSRVRAQVGSSLGLYDFAGRTIGNPTLGETQCFLTAGFYKRSDVCCGDRVAWGVVYDQFWASNWGWAANSVSLGQIRMIAGYALSERNEVGALGTVYTQTDTASFGSGLLPIHAANQLNGFWRHNWELGASTMAYAGLADEGTNVRFVTGLQGQVPLNDYWSAYGNYTYVTAQGALGRVTAAQDEWNIGFGMMYSLGGKARSGNVSGQQGLPLLPVANNGSFLITQQ